MIEARNKATDLMMALEKIEENLNEVERLSLYDQLIYNCSMNFLLLNNDLNSALKIADIVQSAVIDFNNVFAGEEVSDNKIKH